ncbi:hypothetical protein, partial [Rhodomicrobium udaipurense]|uniref:hypothetical protein n=1 Tax=Rhodomicrobium udaipurense TaxID=1202716 RepID=UPI003B84A496
AMPDTPFRETPIGRSIQVIREREKAKHAKPDQRRKKMQRWSAAEMAALKTMWERGTPRFAIAQALEKTPNAVTGKVWRAGFRRKRRAPRCYR